MSTFDPNRRSLPEWIDYLNQIAEVFEIGTDMQPGEIIEAAAAEANLKLVLKNDTDAAYETPNGVLLNARIGGRPTSQIEPEGLGFDDNLQWFYKEVTDETDL